MRHFISGLGLGLGLETSGLGLGLETPGLVNIPGRTSRIRISDSNTVAQSDQQLSLHLLIGLLESGGGIR